MPIKFVREVAESFQTKAADEKDHEEIVLRLPHEELNILTEQARKFGYASRADYIADALSFYEFIMNKVIRRDFRLALVDKDQKIVDIIELE